MKSNSKILSIIGIIIVITMFNCKTQQPVEQEEINSLKGVWEFVSGESTTQDTIITYPGPQMPDLKSFKFITEKHWAVTGMAHSQEMNWGFSGPYRLTDDTYVEYFFIHSNPEILKDSAVYSYTLEGDTWIISQEGYSEKWKRIE